MRYPAPGTVVESGGAVVYLPTAVARALTDQTLDAETKDQGDIEFRITSTPTPPPER